MPIIPGFLISLVTFPGVIVHEIAHMLFCRLANVAIFEVCYFRIGNPCGYVIHEIPAKESQNILIGIGPFIVNSLVGSLISLPAAIPVIKFGTGNILDYFLIWLGVSIAMHSFPSTGDAKSIWESVRKPETPLYLKVITAPIVGIIYICAIGSFMWLDFFYGIGVAMFIPSLLINLMSSIK